MNIIINDQQINVPEDLYHLYQYAIASGVTIDSIADLINLSGTFLQVSKVERSELPKELQDLPKFSLFHTIRPNTPYYHQQEGTKKDPKKYLVLTFSNGEVKSDGPGRNYPIRDCKFYTLITTMKAGNTAHHWIPLGK